MLQTLEFGMCWMKKTTKWKLTRCIGGEGGVGVCICRCAAREEFASSAVDDVEVIEAAIIDAEVRATETEVEVEVVFALEAGVDIEGETGAVETQVDREVEIGAVETGVEVEVAPAMLVVMELVVVISVIVAAVGSGSEGGDWKRNAVVALWLIFGKDTPKTTAQHGELKSMIMTWSLGKW